MYQYNLQHAFETAECVNVFTPIKTILKQINVNGYCSHNYNNDIKNCLKRYSDPLT